MKLAGLILVIALAFPAWGSHRPPHTGATATPTPSGVFVPGKRTKTTGCVAVGALEDIRCTPGSLNPDVTQATIGVTICVPGYTARIRSVPRFEKDAALRSYGFDPRNHPKMEADHLISLELGGANDMSNIWPELEKPSPGFRTKDVLETKLKHLVCQGKIALSDAQRGIVTDWLALYVRLVGPPDRATAAG